MSQAEFNSELKAGLRRPAYILYSDEKYLLAEASISVKAHVPEADRDFMFHAFDMETDIETITAHGITDELNTSSLMPGRKTVIVYNCQKFKAEDFQQLAKYAVSPSQDSVLILLYTGTLRKTAQKALGSIRAIGLDIGEREFPSWIRKKSAEKGIRLTDSAIDYLLGIHGQDMGILTAEIEKLHISGKKEFDDNDIRKISSGAGGYTAFQLTDAIKAKDQLLAFRIYKILSETQEPYSLLGALNWHYGRLHASKEEKQRIFSILNEADIMIKRTGGIYPMEHLIIRLLRL